MSMCIRPIQPGNKNRRTRGTKNTGVIKIEKSTDPCLKTKTTRMLRVKTKNTGKDPKFIFKNVLSKHKKDNKKVQSFPREQ